MSRKSDFEAAAAAPAPAAAVNGAATEAALPPPNATVPPQSLEAEESVLGAMMLSPGAVDAVSELLEPGDFYRGSHARVFEAAVALHAAGEPVDAITVVDRLELLGTLDAAGGRQRIHELAALVPATANAAHYARIVRENATLRGLIRVGQEIQGLGWDRAGEASDLVEQAETLVLGVARARARADVPPAGPAARAFYVRLQELHEQGREIVGLPTGFGYLDALTSGLQPGNLVIVAARPSMGKSALALSLLAQCVLRNELPAALFTLEMNTGEVIQRLAGMESGVDSQKLRNGRLDREEWGRVAATVGRLENSPLFVDDAVAATVSEVRSRARRLKLRQPGLALVVVDYLQLMSGSVRRGDPNRVQEVSEISRALKNLAGELAVPVLAVSQLSRAPEGRHDKRPVLSDLRESGSIEQDADLVMFLYREEYYNPEDPEVAGLAELNLAKQRNGPTGVVKLTFVKKNARFSDPPTGGSS
jgi:replicative DNA helicase